MSALLGITRLRHPEGVLQHLLYDKPSIIFEHLYFICQRWGRMTRSKLWNSSGSLSILKQGEERYTLKLTFYMSLYTIQFLSLINIL